MYIIYTFRFYCILIYGYRKKYMTFFIILLFMYVGSLISWMKLIYREGYLDITPQKISLLIKCFNIFQLYSYQKIVVHVCREDGGNTLNHTGLP